MGRLLPAGAALAHTVLQGRAKRADFFGRCVFQRLEKGWLGPHFLSQTLEKGWLAKTAVFQHKVFDCNPGGPTMKPLTSDRGGPALNRNNLFPADSLLRGKSDFNEVKVTATR